MESFAFDVGWTSLWNIIILIVFFDRFAAINEANQIVGKKLF